MKRTLEVLNGLGNGRRFREIRDRPRDVFVLLRPGTIGLISLAPIYDSLRARGYQ